MELIYIDSWIEFLETLVLEEYFQGEIWLPF